VLWLVYAPHTHTYTARTSHEGARTGVLCFPTSLLLLPASLLPPRSQPPAAPRGGGWVEGGRKGGRRRVHFSRRGPGKEPQQAREAAGALGSGQIGEKRRMPVFAISTRLLGFWGSTGLRALFWCIFAAIWDLKQAPHTPAPHFLPTPPPSCPRAACRIALELRFSTK